LFALPRRPVDQPDSDKAAMKMLGRDTAMRLPMTPLDAKQEA
jgi:hypothetical protein